MGPATAQASPRQLQRHQTTCCEYFLSAGRSASPRSFTPAFPPHPALHLSSGRTKSKSLGARSIPSACSRPGSCLGQALPGCGRLCSHRYSSLSTAAPEPRRSLPFPENMPLSPPQSSARATRMTSTPSTVSTETCTPALSRSHGGSRSWTPSSGSSPRAPRSTR